MREALAGQPDTIPRYARITGWEELEKAAAEIGYPAVLKPTSASGSKGIFILHREAELRGAFDELMRYTRPEVDQVFTGNPNELIFEEFLAGSEHSVEGLVYQGEVVIAGVTDKETSEPFRLEVGHAFPSALEPDRYQAVLRLTRTVATAIGLDNCAFHLECMVGPDGTAKLVEVAARPGGDYISSHLVGLATGASFCENVLRVATGTPPRLGTSTGLHAGLRKVMAGGAGVFQGLDGLYPVLQHPGVKVAIAERPIGARVALPPADYGSSTLAAVIAVADSDAALRDTLRRVAEDVRPRIDPAP
jgi:biotin carboxylase